MAKYLLKWEATNFDGFIFDTDNLSVMRGGSCLLDEFKGHNVFSWQPNDPQIVYEAASEALYYTKFDDSEKAHEFGMKLVNEFREKNHWSSAIGVAKYDDKDNGAPIQS